MLFFRKDLVTNQWLLCIVVVLLAALVRLPLLQYAEFKGDEALNLLLATRPIFHHPFLPAAVTSSAGILNFPLINYLLFSITLFTVYPPTISLVIASINVCTIGGFFLLFCKYHNRLTAYVATILIALSPWAILYSRKIWAQDFLLPLSLPFFLSVYKIREGDKRYWMLFGVSSLFLLQIHQLAGIIPLLVFTALYKQAFASWKFFISGILLGLIPTVPYIWYVVPHSCITCQNTTLLERLSFHAITSFIRPLQMFSIGNFYTEFGSDYAFFATRFHFFFYLAKFTYISYILIPVSGLLFWFQQRRLRFFVLVCFAYMLVLFAAGIESLMHYYILLIPFFALFLGNFFSFFMTQKKTFLLAFSFLLLYCSALIAFDSGIFLILAQKGGLAGEYGAGYIQSKQEANKALKRFKNYSNYNELELFYFSPLEYLHGYMPIAKMIFPYSMLQRNEKQREKEFIRNPDNPLLLREVFAYYTQQQYPSWNYVVGLKEKTRQSGAYAFIYQTVLQDYLTDHLKNLYETPDFLLLYPHHWQKIDTQFGSILTDNQVSIAIRRIILSTDVVPLDSTNSPIKQTKFVGSVINEASCLNNGVWCGEYYEPILLRSSLYQFSVYPNVATNSLQHYALHTFDEVTHSIILLR